MRMLLAIFLFTSSGWTDSLKPAQKKNNAIAERREVAEDLRLWAIIAECSGDSVETIFVLQNISKTEFKIRELRNADSYLYRALNIPGGLSQNLNMDAPKNENAFLVIPPGRFHAARLKSKIEITDSIHQGVYQFLSMVAVTALRQNKEWLFPMLTASAFHPNSNCDKLVKMLGGHPEKVDSPPGK